ncbi:MAG TPA: hypothetical protein VGK93_01835 [Candidatus Eisenbacteria bacterium]
MAFSALSRAAIALVLCVRTASAATPGKPYGEDLVRTGFPLFTYGVGYTVPQKVAASFTVMRASTDGAGAHGWFIQLQPGLAAGEFSVAYGGIYPTYETEYTPPFMAIALKASVVHTWGSPQGFTADRTFIGPRIDLMFLYLKYTAGWLWESDAYSSRGKNAFTWGLAVGF